MSADIFDPFEDRLSRDIRNSLSRVFMETLGKEDMGPVQKAAEKYLHSDIAPFYHEYIQDRLFRYGQCLQEIVKRRNNDVIFRALILWDQDLFFEVHELLEEAWHKATGNNRKVLQGLIRAAGVYVHLPRGNSRGAKKMAAKAREALSAYQQDVPEFVNLDKLLHGLETLNAHPPKLLEMSKRKNSLVRQ